MIPRERIQELTSIAEKATPGKRHVTHLNENEPRMDIESEDGHLIADEVFETDASFMCAFDPPTVQKLLRMALAYYRNRETLQYFSKLKYGEAIASLKEADEIMAGKGDL